MTSAAARSWRDALLDGAVMAPRELGRARSVLGRWPGLRRLPGAPSLLWLLDYDVVEAFCVRGCAGRTLTRGTSGRCSYQPFGWCTARRQRATPFAGAKARLSIPRPSGSIWPRFARAQRDPRSGPRRWRWWCSARGGCGWGTHRCAAAT
jgi:hypothetical protein